MIYFGVINGKCRVFKILGVVEWVSLGKKDVGVEGLGGRASTAKRRSG